MQYQVPQFIYRDPKIVGPLTFKQFMYVGGAAAICIVLYVLLAKRSFIFFVFMASCIVSSSALLAFGQVGGRSVPSTVTNLLFFAFSRKLFLWKKKENQFKIILREPAKSKIKRKNEFEPSLRVAQASRLKNLATEIETKK